MLVDSAPADAAPADAAPADPVLVAPVLAEPVLVAPAPGDSAPADLLVLDAVSPGPVLVDPLSAPVPAAGGVLSVGLLPVPPPAGGVDGGDTVVGELLEGADAGGVAEALADWDGWPELVSHCVPVAPAGCLPVVALLLDFADAVVLALAVELALAVPVAAVVAVPVVVVVALSPGLPPVLPLAGLLAELAGGALGVADLVDAAGSAFADDDEPVEHGATGTLLWTAEVPAPPAPPADAPAGVPVAFRLGAGPLELGPVIPTAELSWPTA